MRRILFLVIPLILIIAAGVYFVRPILFDDVVDEDVAAVAGDQIIGTGTFTGVDDWHEGQGTATLVRLESGEIEIRFEDFEVTNGPDLEVWLSNHEFPRENADVSGGEWIDLGRLKGNVGNQAYILPADANLDLAKSVTIWCEQFGVLFASASLVGADAS